MRGIIPDTPVLLATLEHPLVYAAALRLAARFPRNRIIRKTGFEDSTRHLQAALAGDLSIVVLDPATGVPLIRTAPGFYQGEALWWQ